MSEIPGKLILQLTLTKNGWSGVEIKARTRAEMIVNICKKKTNRVQLGGQSQTMEYHEYPKDK